MSIPMVEIGKYDDSRHRAEVIELWKGVFGYEAVHNEPGLVIDKKLCVSDGLFFVAVDDDVVIGTVMAGYDGHRGWIYSLAVAPARRNAGIGSALVQHAEEELVARGCVKINLQIIAENEDVQAFYLANGYKTEKRISMGKQLTDNGQKAVE
jgi:ribosomal protein S18 acetylase RimI-like enzyme